jgi:hypothetical protein
MDQIGGDEQNPDDNLIISGAEALADQAEQLVDGNSGNEGVELGEEPALEPLSQEAEGAPEQAAGDSMSSEELSGADPQGEGSDLDPNLSVDELLGEAVLADAALEAHAAPLPDVPPSQLPTFQLHLRGFNEAQRPALKKLLEAHGLSLPEKNAGAPVVSQLTEFQAVLLLQGARALGIAADGSVALPSQTPSEDDIALGDLLSAPEAQTALVESAPSVALPKGEKDVLLCSPTQLPGLKLVESQGIVIAHRSIARRLFREEDMREKLEKELKSVPGRGATSLASSHLQQVLRDLMLDLRKSALGKGANSVLGVKIEAFPESSSTDPLLEQLRLVAFGTAALVEKT